MDAEKRAVAAENRAEETALQLSRSGEELAEAKLKASQLRERLQSVEWARASLEAEMKRTKVPKMFLGKSPGISMPRPSPRPHWPFTSPYAS